MCMRNVMQIHSLFIAPIFCRMGWRRGNSIQNVSLRYSIAIDYKFHIETVNIDEAIDVTWLYFKCNSWKFFLSMFSLVYAFRMFRRILFLFILACLACTSQKKTMLVSRISLVLFETISILWRFLKMIRILMNEKRNSWNIFSEKCDHHESFRISAYSKAQCTIFTIRIKSTKLVVKLKNTAIYPLAINCQ